jgi:hypothetical protein
MPSPLLATSIWKFGELQQWLQVSFKSLSGVSSVSFALSPVFRLISIYASFFGGFHLPWR